MQKGQKRLYTLKELYRLVVHRVRWPKAIAVYRRSLFKPGVRSKTIGTVEPIIGALSVSTTANRDIRGCSCSGLRSAFAQPCKGHARLQVQPGNDLSISFHHYQT
jgi:hypothetical protein